MQTGKQFLKAEKNIGKALYQLQVSPDLSLLAQDEYENCEIVSPPFMASYISVCFSHVSVFDHQMNSNLRQKKGKKVKPA